MNLLNLDVDAVFEQHNITEIDAISRNIQAEIELKKEELRTMVKIRIELNYLIDNHKLD